MKILNNLVSLIVRKKNIFFTSILGLLVLGLMFPGFLQQNHSLQNLEPYPDGLIYSLSARNFANGEGFRLVYSDYSARTWVGPLYGVALIPGYVLSQSPKMFYILNIFLALMSFLILIEMTWKLTRSNWILVAVGVIYLSHAYVLWLPTVPMAENLLLLLFLLGCRIGLFVKGFQTKHFIVVLLLSNLLIATKYSTIGTSVALSFIAFYRLKMSLKKKLVFISLGFVSALFILPNFTQINPLELLKSFTQDLITQRNNFFSISYLGSNSLFYGLTFLGARQPFLWQTTPLTSSGLSFLILLGGLFSYIHAPIKQRKIWIGLLLLLLSQLPLLLLFYTTDTRYFILTIPIMTIASIFVFDSLISHGKKVYAILFFLITMIIHGYAQFPLYKEIISSNIFGKSQGWQAEGIRQVHDGMMKVAVKNTEFQEAYLVTALPPFLYDAYAPSESYHLLPMSEYQEFASKGEWVWGSSSVVKPITKLHLQSYFRSLLEQNNRLFITNAYITHSHEVISDYEQLKNEFEFLPLNEGCQHACDLFELKLKK